MPAWIPNCAGCRANFAHSVIEAREEIAGPQETHDYLLTDLIVITAGFLRRTDTNETEKIHSIALIWQDTKPSLNQKP